MKKGYSNSGSLIIIRCDIAIRPSFIDYIQGGTVLNFSVAIDFTASNGDPRDYRSLHYIGSQTMENQYTVAIRSVGEIIQDYDTDKQFPGLGFGAKVPPHGNISHNFFLNLSNDNPYCLGVEGLLAAYRHSLQYVQLYGPTYFSPVINHVADFARYYQNDGYQYFILLIITDGIITDMEETIQSIVDASDLPMSVIIVGVGNDDFSEMRFLDSDNGRLSYYGKNASRDIVQFVESRKFLIGSDSKNWKTSKLAKEVLAEIPYQVVSWMTNHGISPRS